VVPRIWCNGWLKKANLDAEIAVLDMMALVGSYDTAVLLIAMAI